VLSVVASAVAAGQGQEPILGTLLPAAAKRSASLCVSLRSTYVLCSVPSSVHCWIVIYRDESIGTGKKTVKRMSTVYSDPVMN
jgi:hypothetical protein